MQFQGYYPLESILQMCGNPNIQHVQKPTNTELTIESRLIHHIITHNILPRSGSYEYITYLDLLLIWCILNKIKIDLPFYIAWRMDTCVKKKNVALPYGFHITSILEKFDIDLSGEKETRRFLPSDVYGTTTMKQMWYILKENIWVKNGGIVEEEIDEEAQMEVPPMGMKFLEWLLASHMLMRITSNSYLGVWTKVGDTISAPVSVWPLEWNISVPVNTGVSFRVYYKYIYIYI